MTVPTPPSPTPPSPAPSPDVHRRSGKTRRAPLILDTLIETYGGGVVELDWSTPFELLVATILSAQSTDRKINEITPMLFAKYPDPAAYVAADEAELQEDIRPTGVFRQKTKALKAMSAALLERHDGEVPLRMADLIALPGVARKTANVVLSAAAPEEHLADPDAGIAVDTHVTRLARRFGFTTSPDPVRIERDLMRLIPREQWTRASLCMILHGRRICDARSPDCGVCVIKQLCPSDQTAGCTDKR